MAKDLLAFQFFANSLLRFQSRNTVRKKKNYFGIGDGVGVGADEDDTTSATLALAAGSHDADDVFDVLFGRSGRQMTSVRSLLEEKGVYESLYNHYGIALCHASPDDPRNRLAQTDRLLRSAKDGQLMAHVKPGMTLWDVVMDSLPLVDELSEEVNQSHLIANHKSTAKALLEKAEAAAPTAAKSASAAAPPMPEFALSDSSHTSSSSSSTSASASSSASSSS